ncbi:hypothetical protein FJV41_05685 [Myxococcus llanfairpwllgwyngyllgogerychwyrndrobwllllantysiliogogogochensis]|uniref:DUF6310 domain-containing protein n=1 Tax=Myxococcus llanfairpwllgwyngyllgogerychwyrndrobwllllantysiliogogogochensis TaxID=2590453 RepID=A0A540X6V6_9BACT|nr:hypothetical protein FJV41_05685 [Myxococcus llanfairpwllgwyngyllgogerychwyrndrobwllllantysiliogogogochensis]
MRFRACTALLLVLSACATSEPNLRERVSPNPRRANLQRAAALPWSDGGRCAAREASLPWPVLAERCYHALDHERIRFNDLSGRCAVASAGTVVLGVGLCVLAAPEIVVGAVVVVGVVVVGVAIKEALDAYELRRGSGSEEIESVPQSMPAPQELSAKRKPKPVPSGQDWFPPGTTEPRGPERRHKCEPVPVPHRGGDEEHNRCADKVPNNSFPGWDVVVNGKQFDALQRATRTLWEVKTDDFDLHSPHSQRFFARVKLPEIKREQMLAEACGYKFVVGVRSAVHRTALLELDPDLEIVVMDWC